MPETLPKNGRVLIERAYELAEVAHLYQQRASGEPYIQHSLTVAHILADLRLDSATIAAGLLHDVVEDSIVTVEDLRQDFGDEVASLVDGVTKLSQIDKLSQMTQRGLQDEEAENLRKMFLAMADDVRVVLIKLADRLHNMRTLESLSQEQQRRIAEETLEIFAPLASRLGIWQMKWELEDLGFRYLDPQKYQEIAAQLDERRAARERRITRIIGILEKRLGKDDIEADISGRPKHIYSIYAKMNRKSLPFEQIHDVRGVRIIANTVRDCYAVLGIVHSLWRPIPGEFDDFIATPKDNMYQSLHTAVVGPDGKPLEVQIRTHEMHRRAELGIAAHWRYKEHAKRDVVFEAKIAWLRSLMDWRQEVTDAWEFIDSLKSDVFQYGRIYTFTPNGDIIDLPTGSTPIDFAYRIHTEIGHRCRGAKVNGKIVSLDHQLQNGDQVEIITTKRGRPSRDWLNPHLGYIKTSRARQKIRQWFRRQDRAESAAQGRQLLEKELKRLGLDQKNYEEVAALFKFDKVEDLLAAIGYGDISAQQIAAKLIEAEREEEPELPEAAPPPPEVTGVTVRGVGDLLTRVAGCCHPLPGDPVVGYVTRGRGITIHRQDCRNILYLEDKERLIEVDWGEDIEQGFPVMIQVMAYDRTGLMRDITEIMAEERINITSANIATHPKDHTAVITATLEITSIIQLSRILDRIEKLPNVFEARRKAS